MAVAIQEQVEAILHHDSPYCFTRRRSKLCLERLVCVTSCILLRHCEGQLISCMQFSPQMCNLMPEVGSQDD